MNTMEFEVKETSGGYVVSVVGWNWKALVLRTHNRRVNRHKVGWTASFSTFYKKFWDFDQAVDLAKQLLLKRIRSNPVDNRCASA